MNIYQLLSFIFVYVIPALAFPSDSSRVLEIGEDTTITVKEFEKLSLKRRGIRFIDITDHVALPWIRLKKNSIEVPSYKYPQIISKADTVNTLLSKIDKKSMYDNLARFTSFFTRYYKSDYGYDSARWLSSKIHNITEVLPENVVTIEHYDHKKWKQFSIIVKIHGATTPENIIVIGSHQDSMNMIFPSLMAAPGADDDASGTVTSLEALRVYVQHLAEGHLPKNTIEFHFYSAEEGGLLGSLDIFTTYKDFGKRVVAMLQQDMTGYVADKDDEHVGVITDFTTPALTEFIELIIDSYLKIPYRECTCGYACSDHSSATKNGFPATFVLESIDSKTNGYIHSTMDTLDRLSLDHMSEHVKLALGSIIELGEWDVKKMT